MKKLNDKQLNKIVSDDKDIELASEKVKSKKLEIMVTELRIQVHSHKLATMKSDLATLQAKEGQAREKAAENKRLIAKSKGIKGSWGYDPYNGEIIID